MFYNKVQVLNRDLSILMLQLFAEQRKCEIEQKAAKFMGKIKVREGLHKCEKTGGMVGLSKDGKIRYGPGHHCWQCMHRARKGKGGHKHTCGKKPYAR